MSEASGRGAEERSAAADRVGAQVGAKVGIKIGPDVQSEGAVASARALAPGARRRELLGDVASLTPLLGVLALAFPPILQVFGAPLWVVGAPLSLVYIFGVWAALIVIAAAVAAADRALERPRAPPPGEGRAGMRGRDGGEAPR